MTESSLKNDDDKVIKGFRNEKSPAQLWAERKAKQNSGNAETKAEAPKPEVPEDEPEGEPDVKDLKSKFEGLAASEKEEEEMENKFAPPPKKSEPTIISPKPFSKPQEPVKAEEAQQPKTDYKKIGNPLPGMHIEADNEEEPEENDDDWDDDEEEAAQPPLPSRNVASGAPVQKKSLNKKRSPQAYLLETRSQLQNKKKHLNKHLKKKLKKKLRKPLHGCHQEALQLLLRLQDEQLQRKSQRKILGPQQNMITMLQKITN